MFDYRIMCNFEIVPSPIPGKDMVRFVRYMLVDTLLGGNIEALEFEGCEKLLRQVIIDCARRCEPLILGNTRFLLKLHWRLDGDTQSPARSHLMHGLLQDINELSQDIQEKFRKKEPSLVKEEGAEIAQE